MDPSSQTARHLSLDAIVSAERLRCTLPVQEASRSLIGKEVRDLGRSLRRPFRVDSARQSSVCQHMF
jgi:hypothetical protein